MQPDGWKEKQLSELSSLITKGTTPTTYGHQYLDEGINFFRVENISDSGEIKHKPLKYISEKAHQDLERSQLQNGDLLISIAGALGRSALVRDKDLPANINQAIAIVRLEENCDKEYIQYAIASPLVQKQVIDMKAGLAQSNLNLKQVGNIKTALPPIDEQRKIADVLQSVDEAITATQDVIDQTRKVKQGVLHRLLTRGIGHTTFKQTDIGEIPENWEVVELAELIENLTAGVSVNSESRQKGEGEYGILKTSAVTYGTFLAEEHKTILPHELERAKVNPCGNSIIISRMNTPALVGANAYVKKDHQDLFLPDRLWMVVAKNNAPFKMRWLAYLLGASFMRDRISGIATGTSNSMKNISKKRLLGLRIALPPIEEQEEVMNVLSSLDDQIEQENASLEQLQTLKAGVMSDLLSGRVRVPLDNTMKEEAA